MGEKNFPRGISALITLQFLSYGKEYRKRELDNNTEV